jgi:SPP1 gp7 family putative phage head morphogenesis protein
MAKPVVLPSDRAAAYLVKIYAQLDKDLQAEIDAAASTGFLGDTVADLQKRQARVAVLIAKAQQQARPALVALAAKGYEAGADFILRKLRKQGLSNSQLNALIGPRDSDAVRILAENIVSKFEQTEILVGRRVDDALRSIALEQTTASLAAGEARLDLSDRLERALTRAGITRVDGGLRLVPINGRNYQLDKYARMVARTTTREAATQGMANRLRANGIDLYTVDDHQGACEICAEFNGNTYSLDGATPGYEVLDDLPPFHPSCRCVLTPAAIL